MIEIKKIEPIDLPANLISRLERVYHIALRDFAMMIDKKNLIMYVNTSVPEEDVQCFVDYIYYPGESINTGKEDFINYVIDTYGDAVYIELFEGYKHLKGREQEIRTEKLAKVAIPMIEKEIESEKPVIEYDERLLHKVYSAGYEPFNRKTPENITNYGCVYLFYLGYLMGAGLLKNDSVTGGVTAGR